MQRKQKQTSKHRRAKKRDFYVPLQKAQIQSCWSCCVISPPMPTDSIGHSPPEVSRILLVFFVLALLLFILLTFFTLYVCRFVFIRRRHSSATTTDVAPPRPQVLDDDDAVGLDPSLVASFPAFTYSLVKNLHEGKYGLECAVCLSEFQDDDVLRLLTACRHVFHTNCIDVWLMSHTTCPYCRHDLNPDEKKPPEVRILVAQADAQELFDGMRGGEEDVQQQQQQEQRRSVSFKEEGEEGRSQGSADEGRRSRDLKRVRSNSTGHSSMGREDRFTLRLPKDVKERIARERNWTGSCIDFRDLFRDADDAKEEDGEIGRSGLSERGCSRM